MSRSVVGRNGGGGWVCFFNDTATTEIYTLSLHDALPISVVRRVLVFAIAYNLGAVALAYAGHMEPWIAALLMPLSSLGTVAGVLLALGLHRSEPRRTRTPAASPALA